VPVGVGPEVDLESDLAIFVTLIIVVAFMRMLIVTLERPVDQSDAPLPVQEAMRLYED